MTNTVLDAAHLSEMTAGDIALQREVAGLFFTQAAAWDEKLAAPEPQTDWKILAHTMKGSAKGLGLSKLAETSARVEAAAANGVSPAQCAELRATLHEAVDALRAHVAGA